jgi:hypothetical protein
MLHYRRYLKAVGVLLGLSVNAMAPAAEDETLDKIFKGIESSYEFPVGELFEKKYDSEFRNLFDGVSLSFSHNLPLRGVVVEGLSGFGNEGASVTATSTTSMNISYKPFGYWYMSLGIPFYSNPDLQAPWNPDFTYVFGYRDWHPYTLGFTYSNYGGNRFNPDPGKSVTCFECGAFTWSWKFPVPRWMTHPFVAWEEGRVGCTVSYTLVPKYTDLASNSVKDNKQTLGMGCRYNIVGWWYFQLNVKHYLDKSTIQPWDADYTYGFGYFDWHPGVISIQYNNYSNNRFPWSEQPASGGKFRDGALSVSWGMSF